MSEEGLGLARAAFSTGLTDRPLSELSLLCPITPDRQLIAQGLNYSSHLREIGIPSGRLPFNTIFRKASSCLAPAHTPIVRPNHVQLLDYEIEVGIVMRKSITGPEVISERRLAEYVGALVLHNDVSARDVQLPQVQFYKGKSYRTFGPTGPWLTLVDADDLRRFDEIELVLQVNGQDRQRAHVRDISYRPAETLTELSTVQDLGPGDVIVTGTPGGTAVKAPSALKVFIAKQLSESRRWKLFIAAAKQDPDYLQNGDQLHLRAATADGAINLGEHHNTVVSQEHAR